MPGKTEQKAAAQPPRKFSNREGVLLPLLLNLSENGQHTYFLSSRRVDMNSGN
jgi:hypothetical protein